MSGTTTRSLIRRTVLALPLIGMGVSPVPAAAQSDAEVETLLRRVERLERTVTTLERAVYKGEEVQPPATEPASPQGDGSTGGDGGMTEAAAAQLQSRITQLTQEIQQLTGKIEETRFKLRKLTRRVDRLSKDVDYRLSKLEKQGAGERTGSARKVAEPSVPVNEGSGRDGSATSTNSGSGGGGGSPETLATVSDKAVEELRQKQQSGSGDGQATGPSGVLPDKPPKAQYKHAFSLLQQASYDRAEKALAAFVQKHPDHKLAGNAQYWLGETYYVRGNYKKAAASFAKGYKTYPKGQKAPDNLLKLGMSLAELDRTKDACGIFQELLSRFDDAPANIRQRAKKEQSSLNCPST